MYEDRSQLNRNKKEENESIKFSSARSVNGKIQTQRFTQRQREVERDPFDISDNKKREKEKDKESDDVVDEVDEESAK